MFPIAQCLRTSLLMCALLPVLCQAENVFSQSTSTANATKANNVANLNVTASYESVLEMLRSKVTEDKILNRLQTSPILFTLSEDQVKELKDNGASDALIAAMERGEKKAQAGQEISNLAVILDCSGSMAERTPEGPTKMEVAKKVVADLIKNFPRGLYMAFVVYGQDKALGCEAVKVLRPLQVLDEQARDALTKTVSELQPVGNTPIALALETAGRELASDPAPCGILLITDGMETCHGKPDEVAAVLAKTLRLSFGVNVVGFKLNPEEQADVEKIATAGHGKFYAAESADEFTKALHSVQSKIAAVASVSAQRETRGVVMAGKEAEPGAFLGDAPLVPPGSYKGEIGMTEARYFQVPLHKGEEIRAIAQIQKTPYEAMNKVNNQTFSVTIYDEGLARVAHEVLDVKDSPKTPSALRATWTAPAETIAYVALAASGNHDSDGRPAALYKELHPKPSPYTLTIRVNGQTPPADILPVPRTDTKPGNGFEQAGELPVPSLASSDMKLGEVQFYRIKVSKGDSLQAALAVEKPYYNAMNGAISATYTLTVYDDDEVQVAQKDLVVQLNPPDAQMLSIDWTSPLDGNAYVTIACQNSGEDIYPSNFDPRPGHVALQVTTVKPAE